MSVKVKEADREKRNIILERQRRRVTGGVEEREREKMHSVEFDLAKRGRKAAENIGGKNEPPKTISGSLTAGKGNCRVIPGKWRPGAQPGHWTPVRETLPGSWTPGRTYGPTSARFSR